MFFFQLGQVRIVRFLALRASWRRCLAHRGMCTACHGLGGRPRATGRGNSDRSRGAEDRPVEHKCWAHSHFDCSWVRTSWVPHLAENTTLRALGALQVQLKASAMTRSNERRSLTCFSRSVHGCQPCLLVRLAIVHSRMGQDLKCNAQSTVQTVTWCFTPWLGYCGMESCWRRRCRSTCSSTAC